MLAQLGWCLAHAWIVGVLGFVGSLQRVYDKYRSFFRDALLTPGAMTYVGARSLIFSTAYAALYMKGNPDILGHPLAYALGMAFGSEAVLRSQFHIGTHKKADEVVPIVEGALRFLNWFERFMFQSCDGIVARARGKFIAENLPNLPVRLLLKEVVKKIGQFDWSDDVLERFKSDLEAKMAGLGKEIKAVEQELLKKTTATITTSKKGGGKKDKAKEISARFTKERDERVAEIEERYKDILAQFLLGRLECEGFKAIFEKTSPLPVVEQGQPIPFPPAPISAAGPKPPDAKPASPETKQSGT